MDNHPSKSTGEANSKRQPRLLVKKEAKDSNGLVVRGVTRLLACVGGDGSGRGWLKGHHQISPAWAAAMVVAGDGGWKSSGHVYIYSPKPLYYWPGTTACILVATTRSS